jgi:hypothetical protein
MIRHMLAGAALTLIASGCAAATVKQAMTCPIGGETFEYQPPAAAAALGERPDGKPYGIDAPAALPECPGNGLVLYKDYTADEAKTLGPLVASSDYKALRKTDTQYYRAYWLMRRMGVGPEQSLWALLQASWEAEGKPKLRARYLAELAGESAKVPPDTADMDWIGLEGRAINALRELGRFEEASARLAKVPVAALDVAPVPETPGDAARQAKAKHAWFTFFQRLKTVIERKDSSIEPFDLIPRRSALGYCIGRSAKLDDGPRAFCAGEQAAIGDLRAERAKVGGR